MSELPDTPLDPQLILKHIQDGLLIVDTEGRILFTNAAFKEMIGRVDEDLIGAKCCELGVGAFCKDHCPVTNGGDGSCAVNAHFNVQVDGRDGKGEPGAYCFVTSPVFDDDGKIIGWFENFRGMDRVRDVILQLEDVNRAISKEREKTEALVDSMADGVFAVDEALRIRRFSRNMEHMLGIRAQDALGKPCRDVLRGTSCDTDCPLVWSKSRGSTVTGCQETLHTSDGRSIPVTISTGFLKGEPDFEQGLFGVVTDQSELQSLRRELDAGASFHELIGRSASMRALYEQIRAVAPTEATVLITGESGTGKELVARAIHREGTRSRGPFVAVNCAALADTLLESELFGHVRGAFTGAIQDRVGRFEQATGGTLFLDEIGDTSPVMQSKLLRVLQERVIEPVGRSESRKVDVRLIAATNKDLATLVREGGFREDLFYRLHVFPIHVPPLRERRDDVPLLVEHFVRHARATHRREGEAFEGVSERALALLVDYDWPGNVRELQHAVEYALVTSDKGRIERAFLPANIRKAIAAQAASDPAPSARARVAEAPMPSENNDGIQIVRALEANRWNVGRTAEDLGISRTTLWRRMRQFGIDRTG